MWVHLLRALPSLLLTVGAAACSGAPDAAMRGETLEEFQKTRNAPGALYSVAGTDAAQEQETWTSAGAAT